MGGAKGDGCTYTHIPAFRMLCFKCRFEWLLLNYFHCVLANSNKLGKLKHESTVIVFQIV